MSRWLKKIIILLICKAIIYDCTLHSLSESKVLCYCLALNVGDPAVQTILQSSSTILRLAQLVWRFPYTATSKIGKEKMLRMSKKNTRSLMIRWQWRLSPTPTLSMFLRVRKTAWRQRHRFAQRGNNNPTGNCGVAELGCTLKNEQTHDSMSEVRGKVMCCSRCRCCRSGCALLSSPGVQGHLPHVHNIDVVHELWPSRFGMRRIQRCQSRVSIFLHLRSLLRTWTQPTAAHVQIKPRGSLMIKAEAWYGSLICLLQKTELFNNVCKVIG